MIKDIQKWYKSMETRGRIFLAVAVLGLIWLLVQLVLAITGNALTLGWLGFILNTIAFLLIGLVVAQFFMLRRMQNEYEENLKEMLVKGRRSGNPGAQIAGHRNRASGRRASSAAAPSMAAISTGITVENVDKHYRPQVIGRPTVVSDWSEVEVGGVYALEETPKTKVEFIDASDIGGGFFVGKYSGRYVQERTLITNNKGEPVRYATLRNAKQALTGKPQKSNKRKPKSKKKKKR